MSDVKVLRLQTGEDVIAQCEEGSEKLTLKKPFVIIPMQQAPGKPMHLMMTPYAPYADTDTVEISRDKVMTLVKPKKEILNSYQQNTSSILTPNKELITETKLPN